LLYDAVWTLRYVNAVNDDKSGNVPASFASCKEIDVMWLTPVSAASTVQTTRVLAHGSLRLLVESAQ
jgi:hypothetical protein